MTPYKLKDDIRLFYPNIGKIKTEKLLYIIDTYFTGKKEFILKKYYLENWSLNKISNHLKLSHGYTAYLKKSLVERVADLLMHGGIVGVKIKQLLFRIEMLEADKEIIQLILDAYEKQKIIFKRD